MLTMACISVFSLPSLSRPDSAIFLPASIASPRCLIKRQSTHLFFLFWSIRLMMTGYFYQAPLAESLLNFLVYLRFLPSETSSAVLPLVLRQPNVFRRCVVSQRVCFRECQM